MSAMKPDDALPDGPFTPLPERRWRRALRQMLWLAVALLLAAAVATAVLLLQMWPVADGLAPA